jgi:hypothetical protein
MEPGNRKILVYQPAYIWLGAAIAVVILISAAYLLFQKGVHYAGTEWLALEQQGEALGRQLREAREQNVELSQQLAILERSSEIDRLASLEVRNEFAALQDQMLELSRELEFYRSIVSPKDGRTGLQIQHFAVKAGSSGGVFGYQLMLIQVQRNERYVRGVIEIEVEGVEDGKKRVLSLSALGSEKKNLKFKFRYFQEFGGELVIPDGFLPESVTVKVRPSGKGKPPGVDKTMEWPA